MKLSIVIPVYNVEKYIAKCLDSLLAQDLSRNDYEVLVINDGSKDNSRQIAEGYAKKHDNIHVHTKVNSGVGCARNTGLEKAIGEYIYFLDPDDYLAENVLGTILETCRKNNLDILTFISKATFSSKLDQSKTNNKNLTLSEITNGQDYIGEHDYANEVWWFIFKKELADSINLRFIKGRWMEDAIFTIHLFLAAKRMARLPIDAHRHLKVAGSAMRSREPEHYLRVIYDNENAAVTFKPIIEKLENEESNKACLKKVKARQESFVFFMMYRMLFSTIKTDQIKTVLQNMNKIGAYPLNNFLGDRYSGLHYFICVKVFNNKNLYASVFKALNPILR